MAATAKPPVALTVAGSDSGGGAGIQADLKTFHQFGVHGTSVITATTAQNTLGVFDVHVVPEAHVTAQLDALATDLPPSALKSGMLATTGLVLALAEALERYEWSRYVLDPVMVATSGDRLLDPDAELAIRTRLLPLCEVVTPNAIEASVLTGEPVDSLDDLRRSGEKLLQKGAAAALMKGGHINAGSAEIVDLLVTPEGHIEIAHERLQSTSTHGTGCTLAAALTAGLAAGRSLEDSARDAIAFVERAIRGAPGLGGGAHGPLNHGAHPPSWVED